jgi:type II secretory pathway component PulF
MPRFSYVAKNDTGATIKGVESAATRDNLADQLANRGLYLVRADSRSLSGIHIERTTRRDLVIFTSQLLPIIATGVPLLTGLEDLEESVEKQKLKNVVRGLRAGIERGNSLSDSMARYPTIFSDVYVNTVRAGEESGKLEQSLAELRDFLEWQLDMRQRIRNILAYPLMVVVALIGLNAVIVSFAIPRFQQVYAQLEANQDFEMPLPTRIVMAYSSLFTDYLPALLLGILGVALVFLLWVSTPAGRISWDRTKLRIPVFGELLRKVAFSRFAHHFGTMYASGVSVTRCLEVVKGAVGNEYIAKVVEYVTRRVRSGQPLAMAMRETREFPSVVVQMVGTAERTGRMEEALAGVIRFFDREVDATVRRVTTYMGPILLAVLAAVLVLMGTAFYLPLFRLITVIQ